MLRYFLLVSEFSYFLLERDLTFRKWTECKKLSRETSGFLPLKLNVNLKLKGSESEDCLCFPPYWVYMPVIYLPAFIATSSLQGPWADLALNLGERVYPLFYVGDPFHQGLEDIEWEMLALKVTYLVDSWRFQMSYCVVSLAAFPCSCSVICFVWDSVTLCACTLSHTSN